MLMNQRTIETDVCIVGGGTAGVYAAISSAKEGVKTLLTEKSCSLGGTIINGGVDYPGLFFAWGKRIIGGPCWEVIKECESLGGAVIPEISYCQKDGEHWKEQIKLNQFIYSYVIGKHLKQSGASVLLNTMICGAEQNSEFVNLYAACQEGLALIKAKKVVDCTANADIAAFLGYELQKSDFLQPATLINNISGYDIDKISEEEVIQATKRAKADGKIPAWVKDYELYNSLKGKRISMHIPVKDGTTSAGRTEIEETAVNLLFALLSVIRTVKGCENTKVVYTAPETGIRETRRIMGETTVTSEDYLSGKQFDDAISYAFYPVDLHVMDGIKQKFLKPEILPTIPYSALIPKNSDHLLIAGRCLSSDTDANSALRVQAPCMAMGQAAGAAAAICTKRQISVRKVPIEELKQIIKKQGGILPC